MRRAPASRRRAGFRLQGRVWRRFSEQAGGSHHKRGFCPTRRLLLLGGTNAPTMTACKVIGPSSAATQWTIVPFESQGSTRAQRSR